jgi:hypothetical protein
LRISLPLVRWVAGGHSLVGPRQVCVCVHVNVCVWCVCFCARSRARWMFLLDSLSPSPFLPRPRSLPSSFPIRTLSNTPPADLTPFPHPHPPAVWARGCRFQPQVCRLRLISSERTTPTRVTPCLPYNLFECIHGHTHTHAHAHTSMCTMSMGTNAHSQIS